MLNLLESRGNSGWRRKMKARSNAPEGRRTCLKPLVLAIFAGAALPVILLSQHETHEPRSAISEEGLGRAHMETSCSPAVRVLLQIEIAQG
jgi:hypothetical protein